MSRQQMLARKTLEKAVEDLIVYVFTYDSDTFFAKGRNLKKPEATRIVAKLVEKITDQVDGIILDELLEEVRYKKFDEKYRKAE